MATEQEQKLTVALRPDPEPSQHPSLVILVGDAEPAPEAGGGGMVAQQAEAQRVQGTPGDVLGQRAHLALEPSGDLVGRLVGEGDGADAPRIESVPRDEPRDAGDQAVGLAGAGSGDDQHRAERGFDGLALGVGGLEAQAVLRRGDSRGHERMRFPVDGLSVVAAGWEHPTRGGRG